VSKDAEVRQLLQGTALLEFKLLIDPEIALKVYESIDKALGGKPINDTTKADSSGVPQGGTDTNIRKAGPRQTPARVSIHRSFLCPKSN